MECYDERAKPSGVQSYRWGKQKLVRQALPDNGLFPCQLKQQVCLALRIALILQKSTTVCTSVRPSDLVWQGCGVLRSWSEELK